MQEETSLRLLFVAPIAPRQANSTNIELSYNPDGTWLKLLVEHEELLIAHRLAIRNAFPGGLYALYWVEDGPD
jgi:hypothetical protein